MSDISRVTCATHGEARSAYICQHLLASMQSDASPGVHWLYDGDGSVNAWCDACDAFLLANGNEWNDVTEDFAGIRLICENCFETLKGRNTVRELN